MIDSEKVVTASMLVAMTLRMLSTEPDAKVEIRVVGDECPGEGGKRGDRDGGNAEQHRPKPDLLANPRP